MSKKQKYNKVKDSADKCPECKKGYLKKNLATLNYYDCTVCCAIFRGDKYILEDVIW